MRCLVEATEKSLCNVRGLACLTSCSCSSSGGGCVSRIRRSWLSSSDGRRHTVMPTRPRRCETEQGLALKSRPADGINTGRNPGRLPCWSGRRSSSWPFCKCAPATLAMHACLLHPSLHSPPPFTAWRLHKRLDLPAPASRSVCRVRQERGGPSLVSALAGVRWRGVRQGGRR